MKFELNLLIFTSTTYGVKEYIFSHHGPTSDDLGDKAIFCGAYIGNNHYNYISA
jgi:hypothetical protein